MPTEERRRQWREFARRKVEELKASGKYDEWRASVTKYRNEHRRRNPRKNLVQRRKWNAKVKEKRSILRALLGPVKRNRYPTEEARVEALRRSYRKYAAKHPGRCRNYYVSNRAEVLVQKSEYHQQNKDRIRESKRIYRKRNPRYRIITNLYLRREVGTIILGTGGWNQ